MTNVTIGELDKVQAVSDSDLLEVETPSGSGSVDVGQLKSHIISGVEGALSNKVDKVEGKGLSTEDFTTDEKSKLNSLENYDDTTLSDRVDDVETGLTGKVDKVAGKQLSDENFTSTEKSKLNSLENYDDTDVRSLIDGKVDKVTGKQLSDENFTTTEKSKLASLENYDDSGILNSIGNKVDKVAGKNLSTNDFTDDLRDKLAALEGSHFKGTYPSVASLDAALPTASAGDYADVDGGVGESAERYIWDSTDNIWVPSSAEVAPLTASQIKQMYESNPDTNGFTDGEKIKLDGIVAEATKNQTDSHLLNRSNHTGTQSIETVIGLRNELDEKIDDNDSRLTDSREWSAPTVTEAELDTPAGNSRRAFTVQRIVQLLNKYGLKIGDTSSTAAAGDDPRLSDSREWTASIVGQTEAEAGTATTARKWTSQRVRQAIVAWWNGATSVWGRGFVSSENAAAGRTALELGTAATREVTTSHIDRGAGRLLRVGNGGLLGPAVLTTLADLNSRYSGFYYVDTAGSDPDPDAPDGSVNPSCIHTQVSASFGGGIMLERGSNPKGWLYGIVDGVVTHRMIRTSGNTVADSNGFLKTGQAVPAGQEAVTKAQLDSAVGDIASALDAINGEVV